ncbi:AAA family ATPase [Paenibacillus apiarius]|uniref:Nuclease SbcCD subunit C n=1 Tax=Paenibacillus apiarius TaxID=46240 RepID=A0ABT4DL46_9BACL|nr:AAA family ATPase [Paenibacillus apiarius]MCY9513526.1 AAA family ATPase [Paenibacillus apiarius]MCY9518077.1 AAA family ATPase [Paenibacillus apiarius]MCY9551522.1 AAA family ATPase [Paenibacillus apiarius]MCY9558676.1 AAA family ATPase [Paenibacillus apiarius]MCY9684010.1 AAA family ATPase [Paenibacillus apiarius]
MKPIELKLSGLQSYREEQRIDFQALCETGLFGIFGPTGSGKSSLLDAMTLALYGKVERAANGTQGIMNQAEDTLSVSFSFSLNGAGDSRTFRVERRFKRTGEVTIGNTVSRFIEVLPEGEVVLADKLAEVTRCVEHHIGLKMDDFTRAVVLPQGKFAEFLSLKGSDRRQMLQRLFSLEKYGDELAIKLSRKVKETEGEVRACSAEQQGLGDASEEAVKLAEEALREASVLAERAREAKIAAEREYRDLAEKRGWMEEKNRLGSRMAQLELEAPRRVLEQEQLLKAKEAEMLAPFLLEVRELESKRQTAEAEHRAADEAARHAISEAERAQLAADAAIRRKEAEEPELVLRSEQLQEAARLHGESERLRKEAEGWNERMEEASERYTRAAAEAERAEQQLKKALERQAELRGLLSSHEKPSEERELFQQAVTDWQRLSMLEERCKELEENKKKQAELAAQGAAAWNQSLEHIVMSAQEVRKQVDSGTEQSRAWQRLRIELQDELERVEQMMEQTRQAQREQEEQEIAARLAVHLQPNAPCPVCGSASHPAPARVPVDDQAGSEQGWNERWSRWEQVKDGLKAMLLTTEHEWERSRTDLKQWIERLQDLSVRVRSMIQERSGASGADDGVGGGDELAAALGIIVYQEHTAADEGAEIGMASIRGHSADVQADASAFGPHSIVQRKHDEMADASRNEGFDRFNDRLRTLTRDTRAMGQRMERIMQQVSDKQWELQQALASHKTSASAFREAELLWDEAEQSLREQHANWDKQYQRFGWLPGEMERAKEQWREREAIVADCRVRLEKSVAYIEETQRHIRRHEQLKQAADMERVKAKAEWNGIVRMIADYETRLRPWLGGSPIEQLAVETSARLTDIRQRAERTRQEANAARNANEAAQQRAALAAQAWNGLCERAVMAEERLQAQLSQSSFIHTDDVLASRHSSEERKRMEADLERYHEELRDLGAQLKRLEERLGGTSVTEEEWQACAARWQQTVESDEAALAARARAERDAEELRSKHERWAALEAERVRGETYLGRLHQLQSVFRGNAFVEFVAEEQLMQVSRTASERLKSLTKQRYALEVDSGGGFVIRDDGNGGIRRPVSTLSGGETFLTSLALALALSAQIQLRGMYPLEFFFLDEGFGTLDPELLDTVVTSLEKLHTDRLSVGVISHVPELRARLPRKLEVMPAEQAGRGSRIVFEVN